MGSKSTPGGTSTSTSNVNMGPWTDQQPYLKDVFGSAQYQYGQDRNNQYYGGETVAPIVPGAASALNTTMDMGNSVNPNVAAAGAQNLSTINGDYLNNNPYIDKTFNQAADAVTRQYQTGTSPENTAQFALAGRAGSGSQANATKQNQLTYGTTLDNLATSIYGGNYANERQNQMTATGQAPALNQAQYINPAAAIGAGQTIQQTNQNQDTSNLNAYNYNRDQPANALAQYMSLVGGNYGQSGTTQTQTQAPPTNSNPLSSILGGALGLGSLAIPGAGGVSALGNIGSGLSGALSKSDRRLKTDIRLIGKSFDGQNIYAYRFKGEAKTQIGLMAQEVRETRPDAVAEHPDGYLMVDYAKALEAA